MGFNAQVNKIICLLLQVDERDQKRRQLNGK